MSLTRKEAIEEACKIVALVYHSIGDYSEASDGFCRRCKPLDGIYRNEGKALAYVREAVVQKLYRDGFKIHPAFDPDTGEEI